MPKDLLSAFEVPAVVESMGSQAQGFGVCFFLASGIYLGVYFFVLGFSFGDEQFLSFKDLSISAQGLKI